MKRLLSLFLLLSLLVAVFSGTVSATGYEFSVSTETAKLTIQVNTGGGKGTVTGAGEYAIGSSVTVKAYPDMGYGFYGWSGEGDRFITSQLDYTFTITEDTVLFADFTTAPFEDICGRDYFYDAVVWAVDEGITTGTSKTAFSPLNTCTRGQVVTFLHRSAGSPWPHSPISPFIDVTGGEYYYDAVMWAVGSKITTGTSSTTFSPNAPCTRAQVVTFMWRANGCPKATNTDTPFTDVEPGTYYYDAVLWAVERGVTTGTSATTFSPDKTCTRGQIVTFLYRFTQPW